MKKRNPVYICTFLHLRVYENVPRFSDVNPFRVESLTHRLSVGLYGSLEIRQSSLHRASKNEYTKPITVKF